MRVRVWVGQGAWLGLLVAPLIGCALVDQTTFGGRPQAPAPDELAAALASHGAAPLIVIRPADGGAYTEALRAAVATAEAHDGLVRFRLESVVPATGDLNAQQSALAAAAGQARGVMDAMGTMGISPERITLGTRTEVGLRQAEIRLFTAVSSV